MKANQGCSLAFLTLLAALLHLTTAKAHFQPSAAGRGHRPAKRLAPRIDKRSVSQDALEPLEMNRRLSPLLLAAPIFPAKPSDTSADESTATDTSPSSSGSGSSSSNAIANNGNGNTSTQDDRTNANDVSLANAANAREANTVVPTTQQTSESTQSAQTSPLKSNVNENTQKGATAGSNDGGSSGNANNINGNGSTGQSVKQPASTSSQSGSNSGPLLDTTKPVTDQVTPKVNNVSQGDTLKQTTSSTGQTSDVVKSTPVTNANVPETLGSATGKTTSAVDNSVQEGQKTGSSVTNGPLLGSSNSNDKNTTNGSKQGSGGSNSQSQNTDNGLLGTVNNTVAGTKLADGNVVNTGAPLQSGSTVGKSPGAAPTNSTNVVLGKDAANGTVVDLGATNNQPVVSVPATNTTVSKNATQVTPLLPAVGTKLPVSNDSPLKQPIKVNDTIVEPVLTTPIAPIKNDTVTIPPVVNTPINNGTVTVPPVITNPPSKNDTITVPPVGGEGESSGSTPTNSTTIPPKETTPTTGQDGEAVPKETSSPAISPDAKKDHSAFDYANQQKLLLPEHPVNSSSTTLNATESTNRSSDAPVDIKTGKKPPVQVPITISIPSVIAPSGAAQAAVNSTDVVAVSILFKDSMDWATLATTPELVAQIFLFMPGIIADCVAIPVASVTTVRLQRQTPAANRIAKRAESANATSGQTLYVANVPASVGSTLQQKINDPHSNFYTQPSNPVAKELVSQVEPSYDIMQMVQVPNPSSDSTQQGSASTNATLKKALIAIGTILAVCILIFLVQYLRRSAKQKSDLGSDRDTRASSRQNYRDTIQTFGSNARNDLRETWAPNGHEQQQVLHGQLTEAWDHAEIEQAHDGLLTMGYYEPQMMEPNSAASLRSARDVIDPFSDIAANQASQETERSTGEIRNTLLSQLPRSSENSSDSSNSSRMTEAQRILQDYFDSRHNSRELEDLQVEYPVITPSHRNDVCERPAQYTVNHSYGPPSTGSRSPPQRKISISKSSVGQPKMQRNSVLV